MHDQVHYENCPICGSTEIKEVLVARDYTVSKEDFLIMECANCTLRFTQDVPGASSIAPYYKAEDYISHTNTSKGFINRAYQFVRKRTMIRKRKLIQRYTGKKSGLLLDVGSGTGSFVHEMKENQWQATGLEPDLDARKVAAQLYQVDLRDSGELFQLKPDSFDAITLWHVLEHVHDLHGYIRQLRSLLNEKGKLFIAVPNYTSQDARLYQQYWAAYDVPRHLYHFSPTAMEVLMKKNGLEIIRYKPMWYDSFYISLLSSRYRNGKTNWLTAFFTGLRSNLKAIADVKRCSSVIYIIRKE